MNTKNSITELTGTLRLAECNGGFWLWDSIRRMNLSIRAQTPQDALVEGLMYYQRRLSELETSYREMSDKVSAFVDQFTDHDESGDTQKYQRAVIEATKGSQESGSDRYSEVSEASFGGENL